MDSDQNASQPPSEPRAAPSGTSRIAIGSSPTPVPRSGQYRPGAQSAFLASDHFVGSPGTLPTSQSYGAPLQRQVSPRSFTRSNREDYFNRPRAGTSASATPDGKKSKRPVDPLPREWTVFGQLLEDDRTPGIRGSDTPIHTSKKNTPSPSNLNTPGIAQRPPSRTSSHVQDVSHSAAQSVLASSPPATRENDSYFSERVALHRQSVDTYDSAMSEDDGSATPSSSTLLGGSPRHRPHFLKRLWYRSPSLSPLQRNIIKCALAYFIGSLFTYNDFLSGLISDLVPLNSVEGPSPSGHMVATITVYFNPAKTVGAMFEADTYCFVAAMFSSVVCLVSFALFWFFEERPGLELVADACVFLVLGSAMTAVAWSKNWMERASFNTACSMTAIMIFIVVVREGGADLLLHVLFIVLVGSAITNLVCFTFWKQSAATNLQNNMAKTLDSFSTLLEMTTQTFLLQENYYPNHDKLLRAVENHQKSFTSLKNSLTEAKSEWLDPRMRATSRTLESSELDLYDAAVEGLTRIAQHLNGLRDGTRLQFELSAQARMENDKNASGSIHDLAENAPPIFQSLVDDVGPPLEALASACISCLDRMQTVFESNHGYSEETVLEEFAILAKQIERALYTFERTSNQAVLRFFRKSDENEKLMSTSEKDAHALDQNESVFLIYFFIFTLQEFARELAGLTEVIGTIKFSEGEWHKRRQESWLATVFCCLPLVGSPRMPERDVERRSSSQPPLKTSPRKPLRKRLSTLLPSQKRNKPFPKVRPHAPNTIQTPPKELLSFSGRVNQTLWAIGKRLKETDLKYAIKCGLATSMLASPALFDSTREWFLYYRGEWALISFFVVLSPTVGQTNWLSMGRILGTLMGAITAAIVYTFFSHSPVILSIFGALFSVPCFYYIISKPQLATSGRFVLLTYNLTALFCYNSRLNPDTRIIEVAARRFAAVSVGVIWALIVSRWWWPMEARRELTARLSEFCLNLGWLYTTLVETYSKPPGDLVLLTQAVGRNGEEHDVAIDQLSKSVHQFMAMELHLQIALIKMQTLLAQTQHEPRLKGPFPIHLYRTILTSLQVILDKLHSMRCVTTREEWYTTVRKEFIIPVNKQRREMVGNVVLYFSTLASAFTLKRAMPPYLPPAENARQRLVDAIRELDVVKKREVKQSHHLLYFAYALMMKGVIQELNFLGKTLQEAYGVIGQSVGHFEELFVERPEEQQP